MSKRAQIDVTASELAILEHLWAAPGTSVRELRDARYGAGATAADTGTVQKLLQRLESKGAVRRTTQSTPIRFEATVGRDALVGGRLQRVADDLCEGSWSPIVAHLLRRGSLSPDERAQLRAWLDDIDDGRNKE